MLLCELSGTRYSAASDIGKCVLVVSGAYSYFYFHALTRALDLELYVMSDHAPVKQTHQVVPSEYGLAVHTQDVVPWSKGRIIGSRLNNLQT